MKRGPQWIRARHAVIAKEVARLNEKVKAEGLERYSRAERDKEALLDGFFPENMDEAALIEAMLAKEHFADTPLSFLEKTTWSAWFALHPEKIFGQEQESSSRAFNVTVKGNATEVQARFEAYFKSFQDTKMQKEKARLRARALQLRLQLTQLDGMGALGKAEKDAPPSKALALRKVLQKTEAEGNYSNGDKLSFDTVVKTYNQGISKPEIQAWVWYKRTLGVPMTGWEKYFLSATGQDRTVMLYTTTETIIRDNRWLELRTVPAGRFLGKYNGKSHTYDSVKYLVYRDEEGIRLCRADQVREVVSNESFGSIAELRNLVSAGALFYLDGELLPNPVYAYGNMYDRELQLRKDKDFILENYGPQAFQRHEKAIAQARPAKLSIINPDTTQRPRILAVSNFATEFRIDALRDEYRVDFPEATTLKEAFKKYLNKLGPEDFKASSAYQISWYYIDGRRIGGRELSKDEKIELKANARNEGERLFARFLHEALRFEDQQKLDIHWNRLYNGQASLAYHRIPIGFEASAKFKQFNLEIRPAQREGVAFINAVGSGIIAYDVGVGKTMTAIITLADAISSGKMKRPLIVVPNPTYKKWIGEIIGYTDKSGKFIPGVLSYTGIQVNEWYNLGKSIASGTCFEKQVPEKSITIVTYEGMKKIGYSRRVMEEMFFELTNILGQSRVGISERDKELNYQKFREMIGVGLKGTIADIDTLGFDGIVIDEAHRCKNIFNQVKKDERGKKRFGLQGATSETGIKAFFLCNFIQRRYGRNVVLLTATPFTNSPLEIFSMLSLVAYDGMKSMNIQNIEQFFQLFVQESTEFVVNYKEEIVPKDVIRRFNNRLILQKLIYNHIIYKTGEEAGIKRPCKVNLPRVNTLRDGQFVRLPPNEQSLTYLNMTPVQRENQNGITSLAKIATEGRVNKGQLFRSLGLSLDNALSPFLVSGVPEDYKEFVEKSPKIHYTMECIRSVCAYHEARKEPISGQVIYLNRGKQFFPMIKEYLEKELGYKSGLKWGRVKVDEVEIISSEISGTRKENVKEAFLDGVVKIIIGTATIREGIDLQKRSTVLYNLYPDWNPTDIRQLEGRIWRQGNQHGFVRVVMPLVQDSMDVFIFQKLEEKTSRINDIWYRGDRGNVLDLESLDPEEIKMALISDVKAIAAMKLKVEKAELSRRMQGLRRNIKTLGEFTSDYKLYLSQRERAIKELERVFRNYQHHEGLIKRPDAAKWEAATKKARDRYQRALAAWESLLAFRESATQTDKELLQVLRMLDRQDHINHNRFAGTYFKEYMAKVRKAEKTVLQRKGFSIDSNIDEVIEAYRKDLATAEMEAEKMLSPAYLIELESEADQKKSALQVDGKTVPERVKEFARLNYLMSFPASAIDNNNCELPSPSAERKARHPGREAIRAKARLRARALKLKLQLLEL